MLESDAGRGTAPASETRAAGDVLPVLTAIGTAPLVGRDAERALVQARLAAAALPPGAVIVLSGEPGVGKTRLATEAAAGAGSLVVTLRCYEELRDFPYGPFLDPAGGLGEVPALLSQATRDEQAPAISGPRFELFEHVDR